MPPSDLDIARAAHPLIQQHGDAAGAREMVEKMRRRGDADGADIWLRIIVAIGTQDAAEGAAALMPDVAEPRTPDCVNAGDQRRGPARCCPRALQGKTHYRRQNQRYG
jgi:hypothetical protein